MNKGKVSISYSKLRMISLIYIALPMLCFFIGWLKWYWIILPCIALFLCLITVDGNSRLKRLIFRKKNVNMDADPVGAKKLVISKKLLIAVIVITFVYLIFCGIGRLWAQSSDNLWRNAIFRDVIVHDWPVYYDKYDGALCYYIGVWLPAAIPGKIVYFFSGSSEVAVAFFLTWDSSFYLVYAIFVMFEFGIFSLLIFKANKKNCLFYVTILQLLVYPFIDVGVNSDLTMRASIPAIFMMFVLCYQYLFTNSAIIPVKESELKRMSKSDRFIAKTNIVYLTLVLCLAIGAVTPGVEFARGIKQVKERGINDKETDYIVTLDRDSNPDPHSTGWPPTNFVSLDYDDVFFFKYFARKKG